MGNRNPFGNAFMGGGDDLDGLLGLLGLLELTGAASNRGRGFGGGRSMDDFGDDPDFDFGSILSDFERRESGKSNEKDSGDSEEITKLKRKAERDGQVLVGTGFTPEVREMLGARIEVDMRTKLADVAGDLAEKEVELEATTERLEGLRKGVVEQGRIILQKFKEKDEAHRNEIAEIRKDHEACHDSWDNRKQELYQEIDDQSTQRISYSRGLSEIDQRIAGFIADLKGSKGNFKKADIIDFLESLRDRAQDSRDVVSHYFAKKNDAEAQMPKPRAQARQEEAEAAAANKPEPKAKAAGATAG